MGIYTGTMYTHMYSIAYFILSLSLTLCLKVILLPLSPRLFETPWESSALKLHPLASCHPWQLPCGSRAGQLLHWLLHILQTMSRIGLCLLGIIMYM